MLVSIGVDDLRFGAMAGDCIATRGFPQRDLPGNGRDEGEDHADYVGDLVGWFERLAEH